MNDTKTKIFQYHNNTDLRKIKIIGTILYEGAEISRRKHLAQFHWRNTENSGKTSSHQPKEKSKSTTST